MITDEAKVKAVVGWPGQDAVFTAAWRAADGYVADRVTWRPAPVEDGETPADVPGPLFEAVVLMTARLLARRNSPAMALGLDELGAVRIPGVDADVSRLIAPYRPVVFG